MARRKKKKTPQSQAALIRQLMELPLTAEEGAEELEALGLDPTWGAEANVAVMRKARKGDVTCLRYLRDTLGEKPGDEEAELNASVAGLDLSCFTDDQLRQMLSDREQEGKRRG